MRGENKEKCNRVKLFSVFELKIVDDYNLDSF